MPDDHPRPGRSALPGQQLPDDLETLVLLAISWSHRRMRTHGPRDGLDYRPVSIINRIRTVGPQTLADLALWEGSTEPAMSQVIARLADGGWVQRDLDAAGRVEVRATDRGLSAAQQWIEGSMDWLRAATRDLAQDDRSALRRAAEILCAAAAS